MRIVCSSNKYVSNLQELNLEVVGERDYEGVHYFVISDIDGKKFTLSEVSDLQELLGNTFNVEMYSDSEIWASADKYSSRRILEVKLRAAMVKAHQRYGLGCIRSSIRIYPSRRAILSSKHNDCKANSNTARRISAASKSNSAFNVRKLKSDIEKALYAIMMSPEFGFDSKEARQYTAVEISDYDGRTKVEVRAEVSFEGMLDIADALNPIIEKYDSQAYFDMEEPGIMNAFIDRTIAASQKFVDNNGIFGQPGEVITDSDMRSYWDNNNSDDPVLQEYETFEDWRSDSISQMTPVNSASEWIPGPGDFDPPEYPDPLELDDSKEYANIHIDGVIQLDSDGGYIWEDTDWSDSIISDDYRIELSDEAATVEHIDEILFTHGDIIGNQTQNIPGTYRVVGDANIVYELSNIFNYGTKDDPNIAYDEISVRCLYEESGISNLEIIPM